MQRASSESLNPTGNLQSLISSTSSDQSLRTIPSTLEGRIPSEPQTLTGVISDWPCGTVFPGLRNSTPTCVCYQNGNLGCEGTAPCERCVRLGLDCVYFKGRSDETGSIISVTTQPTYVCVGNKVYFDFLIDNSKTVRASSLCKCYPAQMIITAPGINSLTDRAIMEKALLSMRIGESKETEIEMASRSGNIETLTL
jgi:hypothetical protein